MVIKFLEYELICQGESDLIRTVDEIFVSTCLRRVVKQRIHLLRKSVEQIRKTPSKFSNITRAEVFLVYTISAKRSLHPSV